MAEDRTTDDCVVARQIDDLHFQMFNSSRLAGDTELWNAVHTFKEKVKALVAPPFEAHPETATDKDL